MSTLFEREAALAKKHKDFLAIFAGKVAMPQRMPCSLNDFAHGLAYYIEQESRNHLGDTGLINLLCKAAWLSWEHLDQHEYISETIGSLLDIMDLSRTQHEDIRRQVLEKAAEFAEGFFDHHARAKEYRRGDFTLDHEAAGEAIAAGLRKMAAEGLAAGYEPLLEALQERKRAERAEADNHRLLDEISGAMNSLESEVPEERKARWERLQALFDSDHPGSALATQLESLQEAARDWQSCICGARQDSPDTHPHVTCCPFGTILEAIQCIS